ncbi:hypothetical protein CgunFtcFv8_009280 [Champsocephalus gunnari]|uniref:Uncharacterized protein n=1 Tax=Champsocephalus gunnari TaxID=52237 RepID=A0AAN8C1J9_CHAGU|nr:hypothetical protein CgunFtcFv8_009280 [Champsocephalus gunnari]
MCRRPQACCDHTVILRWVFRFSCSALPHLIRDKALILEDSYLDWGREVDLNCLTREGSPPFRLSPTPPFNALEVPAAPPLGSENASSIKWGGQENEVILRCPSTFK